MNNYGSKIKKFRVNKGLTQEGLANLLHVTPQAVSKWENNQSEPDLATFKKLSSVLDVSIDDFFENEKIANNNPDLGLCSICHKPYGYKGLTKTSRGLVCSDCIKDEELKLKLKKERIRKEKQLKEEKIKNRKNQLKNFIIGGAIGTALLLAFIIIGATDELEPGDTRLQSVIIGIIMGLMAFSFASQMFYKSWLREKLVEYIGRSYRMPGVIFNLSISGIIWLILVKLLFFFIGLMLSLIVFAFGLLLTFIISPVTYVIDLILFLKNKDLLGAEYIV